MSGAYCRVGNQVTRHEAGNEWGHVCTLAGVNPVRMDAMLRAANAAPALLAALRACEARLAFWNDYQCGIGTPDEENADSPLLFQARAALALAEGTHNA